MADPHELADRLYPALAKQIRAVLNSLRDSTDLDALKVPDEIRDAVRDVLSRVAAATAAPTAAGLGIAFNSVNPAVVTWAERYTGQLITQITEESRQAIRDAIVESLRQGTGPAPTARDLRQYIGLNGPQARALARFEASMETPSPRLVERRAARMLRERATMIARTELITASNQGQQAVWNYAGDNTLIPETAYKEWLATDDERTCFPAGTQVSTPNGSTSIDALLPGDLVETHLGPKRVQATAARFYSGDWVAVLDSAHRLSVCTADHLWRSGQNWVEAQRLQIGDALEPFSNQSSHVVGVAKFNLADPDCAPAALRQLGIPAGVLDRIVPIDAVDLQRYPVAYSEIYNAPADLMLLNVGYSEIVQGDAYCRFDGRFAPVRPVAGHGTEPAVGSAGPNAEPDAAIVAVQIMGRPPAFLGAVAPPTATGEPFPTDTSPIVDAAGGGTSLVSVGIDGGNGERDTARDAHLVNHLRGSGGVIAVTGTEPSRAGTWAAERYAALFTGVVGGDNGGSVVAGAGTEHSGKLGTLQTYNIGSAGMAAIAEAFTVWASLGRIYGGHPVFDISVEGAEAFYANGNLVHNCPICSAMDGTRVPYRSEYMVTTRFDSGGGALNVEPKMVPPAHVQCRCSMVLVNLDG